jgi:predicted enzyme related to lactoylglutathione lyase
MNVAGTWPLYVRSVVRDETIRGDAMFERKSYPAGVPCWVDTMQPDPDAAKTFYGGLFGWEFDDRAPQGSTGPYYVAQLHGRDVAAVGGPLEAGASPFWNTYTAVENADRTATRVREAGGRVVTEPIDVPGAGRMAVFTDTQGAVFSAWEAADFVGAQLVNEPGTWNFSEYNTRDPEEATRFYRAAFGWNVISFAMGDSAFTFFTLPGYGDFLAKQNPELRENIEAQGAPSGFADAVAWLIEQSGEQGPPHWTVTFAVDDADAVATRAEQLGATIVVPPFDAEPVRMTVIADPQGALFTASKYDPQRES